MLYCKRKQLHYAIFHEIGQHMKGHPWQIRMRAAGLTSRAVCRLTGKDPSTLSRQFKEDRVETYVKSVIVAWEIMTKEQRSLLENNLL